MRWKVALRGKLFCGFTKETVHRRTMNLRGKDPLENISSLYREKKFR